MFALNDNVPAAYRRYLEAEIARLVAKVQNDVECRALGLERFAPVDNAMIDRHAIGSCSVLVMASERPAVARVRVEEAA